MTTANQLIVCNAVPLPGAAQEIPTTLQYTSPVCWIFKSSITHLSNSLDLSRVLTSAQVLLQHQAHLSMFQRHSLIIKVSIISRDCSNILEYGLLLLVLILKLITFCLLLKRTNKNNYNILRVGKCNILAAPEIDALEIYKYIYTCL